MAVESKPLFHPEVIRQHLLHFTPPASVEGTQVRLKHWADLISSTKKPTNKLDNQTALDSDSFIAEVKNIRGKILPLTAAGLQALREEYTRTIAPGRALAAEALKLECELHDLVNQAYGLTPEEIELMWATALPRMPIPHPAKLKPNAIKDL